MKTKTMKNAGYVEAKSIGNGNVILTDKIGNLQLWFCNKNLVGYNLENSYAIKYRNTKLVFSRDIGHVKHIPHSALSELQTFQAKVRENLDKDAIQNARNFENKILEDFVFDESATEQLPIKIKKTIVQPFIGFFLHLHPDGTYIIYDWSDAGGF